MNRIGRVEVPGAVFGMGLNPATRSLYVGFSEGPPDGQMFLPGEGDVLPELVGDIILNGAAESAGIWTNKAVSKPGASVLAYKHAYIYKHEQIN